MGITSRGDVGKLQQLFIELEVSNKTCLPHYRTLWMGRTFCLRRTFCMVGINRTLCINPEGTILRRASCVSLCLSAAERGLYCKEINGTILCLLRCNRNNGVSRTHSSRVGMKNIDQTITCVVLIKLVFFFLFFV